MFLHSKVLEISPEAFKQYSGEAGQEYEFAVEVWSLQSGLETFDPA